MLLSDLKVLTNLALLIPGSLFQDLSNDSYFSFKYIFHIVKTYTADFNLIPNIQVSAEWYIHNTKSRGVREYVHMFGGLR